MIKFSSRVSRLSPWKIATVLGKADDFLKEFAAVVGSKRPSLAFLLSFSITDVEQIKRDVLGDPTEQALHMLRAWRRRGDATYGRLRDKLKTISLFRK